MSSRASCTAFLKADSSKSRERCIGMFSSSSNTKSASKSARKSRSCSSLPIESSRTNCTPALVSRVKRSSLASPYRAEIVSSVSSVAPRSLAMKSAALRISGTLSSHATKSVHTATPERALLSRASSIFRKCPTMPTADASRTSMGTSVARSSCSSESNDAQSGRTAVARYLSSSAPRANRASSALRPGPYSLLLAIISRTRSRIWLCEPPTAPSDDRHDVSSHRYSRMNDL